MLMTLSQARLTPLTCSVFGVLVVTAFFKVVAVAERSLVLVAHDPAFPWFQLMTSLRAAITRGENRVRTPDLGSRALGSVEPS